MGASNRKGPECRVSLWAPIGLTAFVALLVTAGLVDAVALDDERLAPAGKGPGAVTVTRMAPPASGLYESWSPILRRPVGRLRRAQGKLPRWLSVKTRGARSTVTFEPSKRVVWRVRWGRFGVASKVTLVDGVRFSQSRFIYGPSGRLQEKRVQGPGVVGAPWVARYRTDGAGRVLQRTEQLVLRMPWRSRRLPAGRAAAVWSVSWGRRVVEATQRVKGKVVRRDRFDRAGRILRSDFGTGAPAQKTAVTLYYRRDRRGRLKAVERDLDGRRQLARYGLRNRKVRATHLGLLQDTLVERHEVLLLLGSPVTNSDIGRGNVRRITDKYSPKCWLNELSTLEYDATGLLVAGVAGCICGFCVDAALPVQGRDVLGVDLHWTHGPWIRLDGRVDVTADHQVITPTGARFAGQLQAGDVVLGADGRPRRLRAVERLARGRERLGRNLRTASGRFSAGGFVFVSEKPRSCRND